MLLKNNRRKQNCDWEEKCLVSPLGKMKTASLSKQAASRQCKLLGCLIPQALDNENYFINLLMLRFPVSVCVF